MIKRLGATLAPVVLSVALAVSASAATVLQFSGADADLNPTTNALIDTHTTFQCSPPGNFTNAFLSVRVVQTRADGQVVTGFGFLNIGTIVCDGVAKDFAINDVQGFNQEGFGWEVGDAVQTSRLFTNEVTLTTSDPIFIS